MRRILLSALAVALWLGGWRVCSAQETPAAGLKPLVTVAFAGYDELRSDIDFVGKLGNNPQLAQGLEEILKEQTQGKGLAGLDPKRPWGAVLQTDGQQFPTSGFIPVSDLRQLMGVIRDTGRVPVPADPPDGVYEIVTPGPSLFVQQKGGWAFITSTREGLAQVPADPQKVLGDLNQKYDLAVRASVRNVPVPLRQMLVAQMKAGAEVGMARLPGESEEDYALRQGVAKQMLQQIDTMLNDLDEVLIGWAIDRQTKTSYIDLQVTAVAGTQTAAQFAQAGTVSTNFAGFDLPGAALTANWGGKLSDSDVAQAKGAIANVRAAALQELKNQGLSPEELKLASQLLSDLLDVAEKTIENKTADGGAALLLKPSALTFVAGGTIADGAKLEKALKQLAGEVQKAEPQVAKILKLDAETYQGIRFHTLAVPTAEMGSKSAVKAFGATLDAVLGISDSSVYLAVGRDAVGTLKQVIDQSKAQAGKQIPPARIVLAATPIAKFIASMAEADGDEQTQQRAAMIGAVLEQAGSKDHLILTSKPVPNGAVVRLEVEEGLLRLPGVLRHAIAPPGAAPANAAPR